MSTFGLENTSHEHGATGMPEEIETIPINSISIQLPKLIQRLKQLITLTGFNSLEWTADHETIASDFLCDSVCT